MNQFPSRFVPLTEFILRNAQWYPDKIAVRCGGQNITWEGLNQRINRLANRLVQSGISKGDTIAFISRNRLEYPEILFGIIKSGGVAVPVSTLLNKESIRLELLHARPKAIINYLSSWKIDLTMAAILGNQILRLKFISDPDYLYSRQTQITLPITRIVSISSFFRKIGE